MSEAGSQGQPDSTLVDLLIKQAVEGLSPAEQRALDALDSPLATAYRNDLERIVAALDLVPTRPSQALPPALRQRLEQAANAHLGVAAGPAAVPPPAAPPPAGEIVAFPPATAAARRTSSGAAGWFAAAACLVLAVVGWLRSPPPAAPVVAEAPPPPPAAPAPPAAPTLAEARAALLAHPNSLKITLAPTKDPAAVGVTGDAVWDPETQKGYLHFAGLAGNDPSVQQYQIWIFDAERDQRYPVDGGVFDVPANGGEVIIPIRAVIPVLKAAAFAVTIEKAGGVVVSSRERVVVLGAAG